MQFNFLNSLPAENRYMFLFHTRVQENMFGQLWWFL